MNVIRNILSSFIVSYVSLGWILYFSKMKIVNEVFVNVHNVHIIITLVEYFYDFLPYLLSIY